MNIFKKEEDSGASLVEQGKNIKIKKYNQDTVLGKIQNIKIKSQKDLADFYTLILGALSSEMQEIGYTTNQFNVEHGSHPLTRIESYKIKLEEKKNQPSYTERNPNLQTDLQILNSELQYAQMLMYNDPYKFLEVQKAMVRPLVQYWYKVQNQKINDKKIKFQDTLYLSPVLANVEIVKKEVNRIKTPYYVGIGLTTVSVLLLSLVIYKNIKNKKG